MRTLRKQPFSQCKFGTPAFKQLVYKPKYMTQVLHHNRMVVKELPTNRLPVDRITHFQPLKLKAHPIIYQMV